MRVITLDQNQFAAACRELKDMVIRDVDYNILIGIATGGLHVAKYFADEGLAAIQVSLRRKTSPFKDSCISPLLKLMPRAITDALRIAESKIYSRQDKKTETESAPFQLPPDIAKKLERRYAMLRSFDVTPVVLIVDDAADSGSTLIRVRNAVKQLLPRVQIVTAVITATRPAGSRAADYALYRNNTLIRFPWAPDN